MEIAQALGISCCEKARPCPGPEHGGGASFLKPGTRGRGQGREGGARDEREGYPGVQASLESSGNQLCASYYILSTQRGCELEKANCKSFFKFFS